MTRQDEAGRVRTVEAGQQDTGRVAYVELARQLQAAEEAHEQADSFQANRIEGGDLFAGLSVTIDSLHPGAAFLAEAIAEVIKTNPDLFVEQGLVILKERADAARMDLQSAAESGAPAMTAQAAQNPPPTPENAITGGTTPTTNQRTTNDTNQGRKSRQAR